MAGTRRIFAARNALPAACLALGIGAHAFLGVRTILSQSAVYDEPLYLAAGYSYWKTGNYRLAAMHHPPLQFLIAAVPLLFMPLAMPSSDPAWRHALSAPWNATHSQFLSVSRFFEYNKSVASMERLFAAGRIPVLAGSCLFLLFMFWAGNHLAGPVGGWAAFAMAALSPNVLAHATLVTNDFLFSALFFAFFFLLGLWEQRPSSGKAAAAGAALGLALCTKFSGTAIPIILALWMAKRRMRIPFTPRQIAYSAAVAALAVALVYRISQVPLLFSGIFLTLQRLKQGHPSFLMGAYSDHGWWYYFPILFLIKTPFPLLIGLVISLYLALRRELRPPWFVWMPPSVFFLLSCLSPFQVGHRHILPVYPFLFVLLGTAASVLWSQKHARYLLFLLGAWGAVDAWNAGPFCLSYFNGLVGGAKNGYHFAVDSNSDWGQGLIALRRYMEREGVRKVYLCYFGGGTPADYGVSAAPVYNEWPDSAPTLRMAAQPRQLLVVSATNFQGLYYTRRDAFGWLRPKQSLALLAGSLLVFDITCDTDSHGHLAAIFEGMSSKQAASQEMIRYRELLKRPCAS